MDLDDLARMLDDGELLSVTVSPGGVMALTRDHGRVAGCGHTLQDALASWASAYARLGRGATSQGHERGRGDVARAPTTGYPSTE